MVSSQPLYSQGILPSGITESFKSCDEITQNVEAFNETKRILDTEKAFRDSMPKTSFFDTREWLQFILGCALKWGKIRLFMIPFFITYIVQFLLSIAGLIAVLFVVYGGFRYATGGLTEDKESGKKIIQHALIGLVVALSAWIVVNFIQIALTS